MQQHRMGGAGGVGLEGATERRLEEDEQRRARNAAASHCYALQV